jgi:hypothetical protein
MMGIFKNKSKQEPVTARAVQTGANKAPFAELNRYVPLGTGERRLYAALREAVPVIDSAIGKLLRLVGDFTVPCTDKNAEYALNQFLQNVQVNACQQGIMSFLSSYLEQLLTYGTAVGEIVPSIGGNSIAALYNASLDDVELKPDGSPLHVQVCRREPYGECLPVRYPELVVVSALNPEPGCAQGISILRGLPFVSSILVKIYNTIGINWDRLGNVRFAVTYKPTNDAADRAYAKERAQQIASEWSRAMQAGEGVSDFVAVGDVNIKVIGADNQILNSEIPVRQMLEQIIAKLGIPPFLMGLSWSSTERMSSQQADILTSELESYRRLLNPILTKICSLWLRLNGFDSRHSIEWNNITLQDEVNLADARLKNAQAAQIEQSIKQSNGEG